MATETDSWIDDLMRVGTGRQVSDEEALVMGLLVCPTMIEVSLAGLAPLPRVAFTIAIQMHLKA